MHDLILKGGRIIDPANNIDAMGDIAIRDGKVVPLGDPSSAQARRTIDAAGCIVAPGFVDLHAHIYQHGTSLGVDPNAHARVSGTTTFVDAGSSGAGNFAGLRHHVIEHADVRILAFLNISFPGIFGFGEDVMVGECLDERLLHAGSCRKVGEANLDLVVGVKVRIGSYTSGTLGALPLDVAIDVADSLHLPVMTHIGAPPPSVDEVLDRMRPGDILTHCFRPFPNAVVDGDDKPRPSFMRARERGVIFDIGHGSGSFSFETCRAMIDNGIPPDVISSDIHVLSVRGPVFDFLVTISKFLNLGMELMEVIRASTSAPAAAISRPDLGHLGEGAVGDAVVLKLEEGAFDFIDSTGATMTGGQRLALQNVIVAGAELT